MRIGGMASCSTAVSSDEEDEDVFLHHSAMYTRVGEGLTKVPAELKQLTHITHVNLHGNAISRLAHLHGNLRDLNLSSNNIVSLGNALCQCSELRILNLSSNQLQVRWVDCTYLHDEMHLRTCKASRVSPISRTCILHTTISRACKDWTACKVRVAGARVYRAPTASHIGRLQHLDLRGNPLSDMQQLSHLAGLCGLRTLLFAGPKGEHACPLTTVPQYRWAGCDYVHVAPKTASLCV